MNCIQHKSNDFVLAAPPELPDCRPIPATRQLMKSSEKDPGIPCVVTFWKPNEEEMRMLLSGGNVMLYVFGTNHPPVAVEVEIPEHKRIIIDGRG